MPSGAIVAKNVIIIGAAGRDFHNFNVFFRDNLDYRVAAFTAAQIPDIAGRKYPAVLAGKPYSGGIPIYDEKELPALIPRLKADICVMAYSDLPHEEVMHKASICNAAGADFWLMGTKTTMLKSSKPVIAICAVRTGSGKSQTTRRVVEVLKKKGLRPVVIRHPMPYGDLAEQAVERFATLKDMDRYKCTIEEREEYELHIASGTVLYAGVDYGAILREAEKEADVIVWDGGNNDTSFYKPDLLIVVADPHRAGHEVGYYPGETNARMADVVVINKVDSAEPGNVEKVKASIEAINPKAKIILADSEITVATPSLIKGKRVLVVEDGPTLTHGGMRYGAGAVAATRFGAKEMVDAKKYAVGSIKETYRKYPHLELILPAMGYSAKQMRELEATINAADCDSVVIGTPIDLAKLLRINKPSVRVRYELKEKGQLTIEKVLEKF